MPIPFRMMQRTGAAALMLAVQACAPDLGPLKQPDSSLQAAASSQDGAAIALPERWWEQYGDAQLTSLIERGLQHSPSLAEATARFQKASAAAQAAGADQYPQLSADAETNRLKQSYHNGIPPAFVPHGFNSTARAALNFDYELDFFGRVRASVEAASLEEKAARLEQAQARLMVSTAIASSYASLVQLDAALDDARRSATVRQQTADLFSKRRNEGLENESGVAEAQASYQRAQAEIAALEEQVALTQNQLLALVGAPAQEAASLLPPQPTALRILPAPKDLRADLMANRPDIQASLALVKAAAKRIDVAEAGYYPNINFSGYIGQQSLGLQHFTKSGALIGSFGPAIHLPLFTGGQLDGQYRSAYADYDLALAQYNGALVNALREVADALTSLDALQKRLSATKAALAASERAYRIVNNRYRGGLATYIEVLRAEDNLLATRRSMEDMRTRAFVLDVALVKALGADFRSTQRIAAAPQP